MSHRQLAKSGMRALCWPWYLYETRRRPPSRWSHLTRRYIGIVDPRHEPRAHILLTLFEKALNLQGEVAECGVFQGRTALALGLIIKEKRLRKKVYAFDSYSGFDAEADKEAAYLPENVKNPLLRASALNQTSLELIERKIRMAGVVGIVSPVRGYFRDTLPLMPDAQYCFVHLDCDLGESYRECLAYFYPRVVPGGYICFDEYRISAWPLTTQAIDESLADKPERPVAVTSLVNGRSSLRWHICKVGGPHA